MSYLEDSSQGPDPGKVDARWYTIRFGRTNNHHKLVKTGASSLPGTHKLCGRVARYGILKCEHPLLLSTAHPTIQWTKTTQSPWIDAIPHTRPLPVSTSSIMSQ